MLVLFKLSLRYAEVSISDSNCVARVGGSCVNVLIGKTASFNQKEVAYTFLLKTLDSDKVIMLAHTYQHKPLRKIKVAIYNHQGNSPFNLWPDVCSGDLQAKEREWSCITPNSKVLTKTYCQ